MRFGDYFRDKCVDIFVFFFCGAVLVSMLSAYKTDRGLILACALVYGTGNLFLFFYDFFRKKHFYDTLSDNLDRLEQKYLVAETLKIPQFYEGAYLCQCVYEMGKSMAEYLGRYRQELEDFREYMEMWVHEAKIPIASLMLMYHNSGEGDVKKYTKQLRRLDGYTDQALYYVRASHVENDYLIQEVSLEKMIRKTALKNKDDLLENGFELSVENVDKTVLTDGKWLEFILNQIINNSIKYKREGISPRIWIQAEEDGGQVRLFVKDNGIGILPQDLPRVFRKSFTGENGRLVAKSTGMGLYIAQKLCRSLGHGIDIDSDGSTGTTLCLTFAKNDFYRMET